MRNASNKKQRHIICI